MKSLAVIPLILLLGLYCPLVADEPDEIEADFVAPAAGGVPVGEKQLDEFIKFVESVESKHAEVFVGAQSGDVFKLYFKGDAPAEVRQWVEESGLLVEIHDKLRFSLDELSEKRDQVADILTQAGYNSHLSSMVGVPNDIVFTVGFKAGLADEEQEILKLLPDDLADLVSIEVIGGKNEKPGMTGYVMEVAENKGSFLLTSYEPSNAVWFRQQKCDLQPGQKVKVWFAGLIPTYPAKSRAIRFEVVEPEMADKSKVIGLAIEKRKKQQDVGILYILSIKHDKANKRWEVLFFSDTSKDGAPDAEPVVISEEEL